MAYFRGNVYSYELGKMTPLEIYLPYDDKRRFLVDDPQKTLVLLHGLGGNNSYWNRYSSAERYAQEHNIALVMPEAGMSMYTNMKCGLEYENYIATELKEIINNLFKLSTERKDYFIAGLSMGGYGALKIAMKYPETFGKCGSFSGAFMIGQKNYIREISSWEDKGRPEKYSEEYELNREMYQGFKGTYGEIFEYREEEDLFKITKEKSCSNSNMPEILMTCGTEDFVYNVNIEYCELLDSLKIPYDFHSWKGIHEWKFWDESIRDYIKFFK
jgi:S-formylglutathione hydrolase FrmB